MSPSIWQLALVAVVVLLLFGGKGRLSSIMGDVAKGIGAFRKGLKDDATAPKDDMVNITPKKDDTSSS